MEQQVKKILIVDNTASTREILKEALINDGYDVVDEVDNGKDALLKYALLHPDLVTIDINLPKENVLEICRKIKTIKNPTPIKIIIITPFLELIDPLSAKLAGANVVVKDKAYIFLKESIKEIFTK